MRRAAWFAFCAARRRTDAGRRHLFELRNPDSTVGSSAVPNPASEMRSFQSEARTWVLPPNALRVSLGWVRFCVLQRGIWA